MKRLFIFMVSMLVWYGTIAQTTLQKIEYFFNGPDPGIGNATKILLNSPNSLNNFPVRFSATGLSPGMHKLYFRVQDSNKWWSQTQRRDVLLQSSSSDSLVAIQYFIGEDPGVGIAGGQQLAVNPQSAQIKNYPVSVSDVPNGYANGYFRVKSANGNWSQTVRQTLQKTSILNNKIVALEYFFKSAIPADSGVGQFKFRRYFSSPAETIISQDIYIKRTLPTAFDSLFFRVQDSYGLWSQTYRRGGVYQSAPVVSTLDLFENSGIQIYPNPNSGTFNISSDGLQAGDQLEIFDAIGKVVHRQKFGSEKAVLNLPLPAGVYQLRIFGKDDRRYLEKLVIQ